MDNTIRCNVDMFSMNQRVFLPDGTQGWANMENFCEGMLNFCKETDSNKIILYGNEEYLGGLRDKIYALNIINYGISNIEVEIVNE